MLRLNRMTDYAILVLGALHQRPEGQVSSVELASSLSLNQTTIAKVIKALSSAELIVTTRGVNGGCQLAVDVSKISVAAVVEAIEGPIALTACVEGADDPCAVRNGCFMGGNWNRVNSAIKSALETVTLAELFDPEQMFGAAVPAAQGPAESLAQNEGVFHGRNS